MAHGFNTTKTADGYSWTITATEWSDDLGKAITTVVKSGTKATRAQALGAAKKWVLFFRRGGAL
jgi:hypothetical protein